MMFSVNTFAYLLNRNEGDFRDLFSSLFLHKAVFGSSRVLTGFNNHGKLVIVTDQDDRYRIVRAGEQISA